MGFTDAFVRFVQSASKAARQPLTGLRPERVAGPPTSSNGASSFHLNWDMAPTPLREVSATVEILEAPTVAELYFWALQVNFTRNGLPVGGAHVGLQHHPNYPHNAAVNWGGYGWESNDNATGANDGGELAGSTSALPCALDNPNTRTFRWYRGRRYRLRVFASPDRGWRATVTDLDSPQPDEIVVRDLFIDADALADPCVWTEVFAHCDHPSTAVRWSDLSAVANDGTMMAPRGVRLNYQTVSDGGCSTTNSELDTSGSPTAPSIGIVQRTNTIRSNQTGTMLVL